MYVVCQCPLGIVGDHCETHVEDYLGIYYAVYDYIIIG